MVSNWLNLCVFWQSSSAEWNSSSKFVFFFLPRCFSYLSATTYYFSHSYGLPFCSPWCWPHLMRAQLGHLSSPPHGFSLHVVSHPWPLQVASFQQDSLDFLTTRQLGSNRECLDNNKPHRVGAHEACVVSHLLKPHWPSQVIWSTSASVGERGLYKGVNTRRCSSMGRPQCNSLLHQ